MKKLICETCNKNLAIGVCSSLIGPMSQAVCSSCATADVISFSDCVTQCFCVPYDMLGDYYKDLVDRSLAYWGNTHAELNTAVAEVDCQFANWCESSKEVVEESDLPF